MKKTLKIGVKVNDQGKGRTASTQEATLLGRTLIISVAYVAWKLGSDPLDEASGRTLTELERLRESPPLVSVASGNATTGEGDTRA